MSTQNEPDEKKDNLIRSMLSSDQMGSVVQEVGKVRGVYDLIKTIVVAVIFAGGGLLFLLLGAPWFIGAAAIVIGILIIVLQIATIRRVAAVDLNTLNEAIPENLVLEEGEVLQLTVPAVYRYLATRSTSFLGTGKVHTPENTLIITNKAIWAMTVPLPGVDKVVAGQDIGMQQWMWYHEDIRKKLEEMLATLPLEEVLKQGRAKRLMGLHELKAIKTSFQNLRMVRKDGKSFRYSVRVKEDFLKAKEMLSAHIAR